MKYFFILLLLSQSILCDTDKKITLRILNLKLEDGELVNIEIKNNSMLNYCFVIDTSLYFQNRLSYDGNFDNFSIYLLDDRSKEKISSSKEVKSSRNFNDSITNQTTNIAFKRKNDTLLIDERIFYKGLYKDGFVSTLNIYKIKSGKSLKLKIPFNLVIKYLNQDVHQYYEIDKSKKYSGRIEYLIKQEYIEKHVSKQMIDSFENTGYKFFVGSLKSNKVPLLIAK